LATAAVLAIGAAASADAASERIQLAQQKSAPESQAESKSMSGPKASGSVKAGAEKAGSDVKVRAKVGTRSGTSRTVVRERDSGPDVVVRRSRSRHVIETEGRPSKVTVVKKKKKFAKRKKRARVVAAEPASRTVIIKKRRPGVIVGGETRTTRTTIRGERSGVNVRARTGGSVNVRTRNEGSATTGAGGSERRSQSKPTQSKPSGQSGSSSY
jgi:hypothetical protein